MKNSKLLKNPFFAFLKLIRIENLLIIAFTAYMIRYGIIESLLFFNGQKLYLQQSAFDFFVLVLSILLIAAAGYIINDYFDIKTDRINHPDTVVIDKSIKRRWAMFSHVLFNILGVALGFWVGWKAGNYKIGIIHLLASGLLWYYSTHFKKQLIIGNLVVSLLCAFIPLLVLVFEMPSVIQIYSIFFPDQIMEFNYLYKYVFGFTLFAFLTSLIREIIKDMEDITGDTETGCETIPVVWGVRTAKAILLGIISNTLLLLFFIIYQLWKSIPITQVELIQIAYLGIGLIIPIFFLTGKVINAKTSADYHKASSLVKIIMLIGINFSAVIYYLANYAS